MVAGNQDITSPREGQSSFPYAAVIKGGLGEDPAQPGEPGASAPRGLTLPRQRCASLDARQPRTGQEKMSPKKGWPGRDPQRDPPRQGLMVTPPLGVAFH